MILDCHTGATIDDPIALERSLLNCAGVAQVGLFNNMCDVVYLAAESGVRILKNPDGRLA